MRDRDTAAASQFMTPVQSFGFFVVTTQPIIGTKPWQVRSEIVMI